MSPFHGPCMNKVTQCSLSLPGKKTGKQTSENESKVLSLEWTLAHVFDI